MLSYRHSYHAGNFADVLKHCVLIHILEHMTLKERGFDYIDTHAGAGLYDLQSEHAKKIEEYKNGIAKIDFADFPELLGYQKIIQSCNDGPALQRYPGSPYIARQFLRPQDHAWLYELHPADYDALHHQMNQYRNIRVDRSDGFTGLLAKVPPQSKRGLILIDPSYEIKEDYNLVFDKVARAYRKFSTGVYAIWYPVIQRETIHRLEHKFVTSGIRNIQLFELGLRTDSSERGMTSSGMIVINPPWKLFAHMNDLLPKLANILTTDNIPHYRCEQLVGE